MFQLKRLLRKYRHCLWPSCKTPPHSTTPHQNTNHSRQPEAGGLPIHLYVHIYVFIRVFVWERAANHKQLCKCLYLLLTCNIYNNNSKIVNDLFFCGGCDKVTCATRNRLLTAVGNKKCCNTLKDNN